MKPSKISLCLLVMNTAACGSQDGTFDEQAETSIDPTAAVAEPILNGTTVTTDSVGTPILSTGCTGTLLTRRWVLTARHCVTTNGVWNGPITGSSINLNLLGGTTKSSVQIVGHPSLDVALIRLAGDLPNASGTPVVIGNRLFMGATSGLVSTGGTTFHAQGWGSNNNNNCTFNTGFGTLRSANLPVSSASGASGLACLANVGASACYAVPITNGQLQSTGDSGSSMFFSILNRFRPFGVTSTATCQVSNHIKADLFRDWANAVIGSAPSTNSPAGYERASGLNAVNGVNAVNYVWGGHVKELSLQPNGSSWALWDYNNAPTNAPQATSGVAQYVRSDSISAVVYQSGSSIVELSLAPGASTWGVFTLPSSAGSSPSAYVRTDQVNSVVYRGTGTSPGPREVFLSPGASQWFDGPLNANAPVASPAGVGGPIGYIRPDGVNAVVYGDSSKHVVELALVGGTWAPTDLTAVSLPANPACPVASPNYRVRPYTRSDGVGAVVFMDASSNIHEISLSPPYTSWSHSSLPNAKPVGSELAPYVRNDGTTAILYVSAAPEKHVHELSLDPNGGGWHDSDLTNSANGPTAVEGVGALGGYVRSDGYNSVVYRRSSDNHTHELFWKVGQATWLDTDLGAP